ncbi:hypothetical protein ACJ72_07313 [Emergomyces africanus]|uniref:Uncharacterized protein n=1 Tax=Emergomyces africanus TaxID=1955775 RepID=A0A1B7NNI7_9EURO|nr:hypothetical protein ACJ72_07313 [Emergomyces africanus]
MARQSNQLRSKEEPRRPKPKGTKKTPTRGGLDALTIAEKQYPSNSGIRKHRLGVEEEDFHGQPSKRRRTGGTDERSDVSDNYGSDSEGNEWQLGRVDEDDDSDIDSDEAMGESDEDHFDGRKVGVGSKGNAKPPLRQRDTEDFDLSEGDGELSDDDDLGEEAVDLATAWDMNAQEPGSDSKGKATKSKKISRPPKNTDEEDDLDTTGSELEEDEDDSGDSDDDDASDASGLSLSDEDDLNERGLSKLQKFVKAMEKGQANDGRSKLKQRATTQGAQPTEFGLMRPGNLQWPI